MARPFHSFRVAMREYGDDSRTVSEFLGCSERTVSRMMSGEVDWRLGYIYKLCDRYDIPVQKIALYFPPNGKNELYSEGDFA